MKKRIDYIICTFTLVLSFLSLALIPLTIHNQVLLIDSNAVQIKSYFGGEVVMPIVIWFIGCLILSIRNADDLLFRKKPKIAFVIILTLNFILVMCTRIAF